MPENKKCLGEEGNVPTADTEFCSTHNCGAHEPCGKPNCPHCHCKIEKLQLTNSYLKAKDFGEVE